MLWEGPGRFVGDARELDIWRPLFRDEGLAELFWFLRELELGAVYCGGRGHGRSLVAEEVVFFGVVTDHVGVDDLGGGAAEGG